MLRVFLSAQALCVASCEPGLSFGFRRSDKADERPSHGGVDGLCPPSSPAEADCDRQSSEEGKEPHGIEHAAAHDALSDVTATIALAKLIKEKQPKLYHFFFSLRGKKALAEMVDVFNMTPLVHTSSRIPAIQGCTTWVAPMSFHPVNKNAVICFDLTQNPQVLLDLNVEELRKRLYTKRIDLAEGDLPVGLKLVHLNKCPILAPAKTLLPENAARLGIDREQCLANLAILKANTELRDKVTEVFNEQGDYSATTNVDYLLYDGFTSHADKAKFAIIRDAKPEDLASLKLEFEDPKWVYLASEYLNRRKHKLNFKHDITLELIGEFLHDLYWASKFSSSNISLEKKNLEESGLHKNIQKHKNSGILLEALEYYYYRKSGIPKEIVRNIYNKKT